MSLSGGELEKSPRATLLTTAAVTSVASTFFTSEVIAVGGMKAGAGITSARGSMSTSSSSRLALLGDRRGVSTRLVVLLSPLRVGEVGGGVGVVERETDPGTEVAISEPAGRARDGEFTEDDEGEGRAEKGAG